MLVPVPASLNAFAEGPLMKRFSLLIACLATCWVPIHASAQALANAILESKPHYPLKIIEERAAR